MKKEKNTNLHVVPWLPVAILSIVVLTIWANADGMMKRFRIDTPSDHNPSPLPVFNQASPRSTSPSTSLAHTGQPAFPTTAIAVQEGISHALHRALPSIVAISTFEPVNQDTRRDQLAYIQPYNAAIGLVGSGVIVDTKGFILTTFQTVGKGEAVNVTVFSAKKRQYKADILTVDPATDLVLLKIRSAETFPAAILGNSDTIETGDIVLAMGNPFGFSKTATLGIVSSNRRRLNINGITYPNLIQTDAAINSGNNGGPLVNIKGEIIGINMAYFFPGSHFTGIGFALPINDATRILNSKTL